MSNRQKGQEKGWLDEGGGGRGRSEKHKRARKRGEAFIGDREKNLLVQTRKGKMEEV